MVGVFKRGLHLKCDTKRASALAVAAAHFNIREFPWRTRSTPYRVLLAEYLLQRTTSTHVAQVYDKVAKKYPSIWHLARARLERLQALLAPLGLRKRADLMKRGANYILEHHNGVIPVPLEELTKIPFVGIYSATCVRVLAFAEPAAPVDINVARIVIRAFGLHDFNRRIHLDKRVAACAQALVETNPDQARQTVLALLDVGALFCRGRPRCGSCPFGSVCAVGTGEAADPLVPWVRE